jgi:hypothetical protein
MAVKITAQALVASNPANRASRTARCGAATSGVVWTHCGAGRPPMIGSFGE